MTLDELIIELERVRGSHPSKTKGLVKVFIREENGDLSPVEVEDGGDCVIIT